MIMASLKKAIDCLSRAIRSRSNLRPVVLFCLGAVTALLGLAMGMANIGSSAFVASLILAGVVLGALAVAAVMLRPDSANDN